MPTSRGRKKTRRHHRRPGGDPRRRVGPRVDPDVMDGIRLLERVNALERAGDAESALDVIEANLRAPDGSPMWGPSRTTRLLEVVCHGRHLPPWARARWLRAQALSDLGAAGSGRVRAALADAALARLDGATGAHASPDPMEMQCRTMDHDWVHAQTYLHEHGGLKDFLDGRASPDLVAQAPGIVAWAETPMAAFRLVGHDARTITWVECGSDREVTTINLGAAATLDPGDHVIGRRVTCADTTLFDDAPLRVSERVAAAVADDPGRWVTALADRGEDPIGPRVRPGSWAGGPSGLLTDLPDSVWEDLALDCLDPPLGADLLPWLSPLEEGAADLVLGALDGLVCTPPSLPLRDPWPAVAAALQMPAVWALLMSDRLDDPDGWWDAADLARLGERLGGLAPVLCDAGVVLLTAALP